MDARSKIKTNTQTNTDINVFVCLFVCLYVKITLTWDSPNKLQFQLTMSNFDQRWQEAVKNESWKSEIPASWQTAATPLNQTCTKGVARIPAGSRCINDMNTNKPPKDADKSALRLLFLYVNVSENRNDLTISIIPRFECFAFNNEQRRQKGWKSKGQEGSIMCLG